MHRAMAQLVCAASKHGFLSLSKRGHLAGDQGGAVRESKGRLHQSPRSLWHCCKWAAFSHICLGGHLKVQHFSVDSTVVAWKNEMALWKNEEWDVYWWPQERKCCGISKGLCWTLGRLWNVIPNLGQWWESPSASFRFLPLIFVTHNESAFFQNNERKTCWSHQDSWPTPKPKGDEQLLMVLDFLTAEWGCLCNGDRCVTLYIYFYALC